MKILLKKNKYLAPDHLPERRPLGLQQQQLKKTNHHENAEKKTQNATQNVTTSCFMISHRSCLCVYEIRNAWTSWNLDQLDQPTPEPADLARHTRPGRRSKRVLWGLRNGRVHVMSAHVNWDWDEQYFHKTAHTYTQNLVGFVAGNNCTSTFYWGTKLRNLHTHTHTNRF